MEKRETIFDYLGQVLWVFGFTILVLLVFCVMFGEDAKEYSTIFQLGSSGLSVATMLQFGLTSVVCITFRYLFFSEAVFKNMKIATRTVSMFVCIIAFIVACIILFNWFPVNDWLCWGMFILSFGVSAAISTVLSVVKEKLENKKMEEALNRLKGN